MGTLTEVWARSRTSGLALKATPSPAMSSMSRSLAPSPMATVRLSGSRSCSAKARRARALPARSTTSPTTRPVRRPSGDLEAVGPCVVDAELGRQHADDLDEAAAHQAHREAQAPQGAHEGARSGRQHHLFAHLVQHGCREAGERGHPGPQRLLEVELAGHGPGGHLGDLGLATAVGREQLDDLLLDEGRVDVEHHEPAAAPGQAAGRHGDVDPDRGRGQRELAAQRRHVGTRDVELDRRHGVARQPSDAVDVGAVLADAAGDQRHGIRPERSAEHDDGSASLVRPGVVSRALSHVQRQPQPMGRHRRCVTKPLGAIARTQHQGQGQVAVDDDLLDVEHLRPDVGERAEQRTGDAGSVGARHGDAESGRVRFGHPVRLVRVPRGPYGIRRGPPRRRIRALGCAAPVWGDRLSANTTTP